MSERALRRFALAAAIVLASEPAIAAQSTTERELPRITGRVVRDFDGANVAGALVEAYPSFHSKEVTKTDEQGAFARVGKPQDTPTGRTNYEPYDLVEYVTISGPGIARTFVDPCADAPWSGPIRVRGTGALRGQVLREPARRGVRVVVSADWMDFCWPPRTGLTRGEGSWIANLDADGRFDFPELPAEVPLRVEWSADGSDANRLTTLLALAPGESRILEIGPGADADAEPVVASKPSGSWIAVDPHFDTQAGSMPYLPAFEIPEGGRNRKHKNAGGRWHVHDSRACNHLEALAGSHLLVGRDARGHFGLTNFEMDTGDTRAIPRVAFAPGALLRIAFDGPEERARIALVAGDIEYAVRELPRGVVWYELAPAGPVSIRVAGTGTEARDVRVEARAGQIEPVEPVEL